MSIAPALATMHRTEKFRGNDTVGHIVVVDDDPATRRIVTSYFRDHDMPASSASGRQELVRHLASGAPTLIILDLPLGRDDGLDLLREIRSTSDVPVIITTGHRMEEVDCVLGLELGADDYLTRPFGLRELLARVRAILRRHELKRTQSRKLQRGGFRFGRWQLERESRRLTTQDGSLVTLTKSELSLLVAFLERPQRPLTRAQLLQATRVHEDVFDRSIDVQVLRLRRKLETDASSPRIIRTERGVGYVFALSVETF
ncbi:MAG: two component response regulator [Gammaproteobacteria bacterium]|nr:two component response regulator [Gammaproteobacteria bacterium]